MANRVVKQPDGLYARFSEIVDDFTHINYSYEDMWELYRDDSGIDCANEKMKRADDEPCRFDEAINIIARHHGTDIAENRRMEML